MARSGSRAAASARAAGSGGPGRPQQLQGKQRSAPWPGPRSKEKKKVNCKPKNQDEQEIPFRLREIMRSRQEMKNPISYKKRKKEAQVAFRKTEKEAKGEDPDIAVPKFKQRKWESDGAYVQRMEQEAQHVLFLSKNQADRQPEAQAAPKEKSEGKKAFQRRRLDKVRQRREEKVAERLEQELLQGTLPEATPSAPDATHRGRQRASVVFLCPSRHSEVWRGRPAAPRADRQAQDEHEQGPAWQETTDAADAPEPWQCVPAVGHLAGPAADRGGGERAGCAGLQGTEEAATLPGDSVSPPPSREKATDASVMARDQGCPLGWGNGQVACRPKSVPWNPRALCTRSQVQLQVLALVLSLPKNCSFMSDHPLSPVTCPSPHRWGQRLDSHRCSCEPSTAHIFVLNTGRG